jgi:hypothetical protein
MSETKGVLKGTSRNASTTCTTQKGSGGPETVFLLPIAARTTVELEVVSTIDSVVAIRSVCDDPLTEVACNDNGPTGSTGDPGSGGVGGGPVMIPPPPDVPPGADGGVPPPPGDGRDALLRATLNPGTYYVIVDQAEPFGVGGEFTLLVRSSAPPAYTVCSAARSVADGTSLPAEDLDTASEKPPACAGVESRPALYYTAHIPSGQRLTVRALPTGGDRPWVPVLQLLSGCSNARCLARDRTSTIGDRVLRYVNNGAAAEDVILSVSASTAVTGATFRMDVSLGEPIQNGTCASARPISDGQVLRNQDLSEGQVSQVGGMCKPTGGQALFYSAMLAPQQRLIVTLMTRSQGGIDFRAPLFLMLHNGCGQLDCRNSSQGDRLEYVNSSGSPQTMILEISSLPGLPTQIFDMMVSMPLPPPQIVVRPTAGLVTTEAGGKATFEVSLGSPPAAPVMIPLESSAPTEGMAASAVVTFTALDWSKAQTVTVTGVDDSQRDGNKSYRG